MTTRLSADELEAIRADFRELLPDSFTVRRRGSDGAWATVGSWAGRLRLGGGVEVERRGGGGPADALDANATVRLEATADVRRGDNLFLGGYPGGRRLEAVLVAPAERVHVTVLARVEDQVASGTLVWTVPPSLLAARVVALGAGVVRERTVLLREVAASGEAFAKVTAPWENITGAARGGLTGSSDADSATIAHGVDYGIWLELANAGVYGVIPQTLDHMAQELEAGLSGLLERAGGGL